MKDKIRKALDMSPTERKAARIAEKAAKKAQTATGIKRNARGQYLPGVCGNNLGRPRTALAELCRQEITKHGLVAVLGNIAAGKIGDYAKRTRIPILLSDRINAIRLLLTYGFGMPKHEVDTGDVRIEVTYADNRSVTLSAAPPDSSENNSGVKTLQRSRLRPALGQDDARNGSIDSSSVDG